MNAPGTDLSSKTWSQTFTGRVFDFAAPDASMICIEDIAHALSNVCRFAGNTRHHYSVAQHSILVSRLVPPRLALAGLLHDASEAYTGDVPKPLKDLIGDVVRPLEKRIEKAIADAFDDRTLDPDRPRVWSAAIKDADILALYVERRDLMAPPPKPWSDESYAARAAKVEPIVERHPRDVEREFLERYELLRPRVSRIVDIGAALTGSDKP